jgi:hypothetical protein
VGLQAFYRTFWCGFLLESICCELAREHIEINRKDRREKNAWVNKLSQKDQCQRQKILVGLLSRVGVRNRARVSVGKVTWQAFWRDTRPQSSKFQSYLCHMTLSMHHSAKSVMLILSLAIMIQPCLAQEDESSELDMNILVHGTVWDSLEDEHRRAISEAMIEIKKDGKKVDSFTTDHTGEYAFLLDLDAVWTITWKAQGRYSKYVELDTRNIPIEEQIGGFETEIDMSLPKATSKSNARILKEYPIGKARYDAIIDALKFDFDYTAKINAMME